MRRRKPPPGTHHHEPWCAIYRGKSCDCDDDGGHRSPQHRPLAGGDAPLKKRELENA
jgi:hypothetical protein